MTKRLVILGGGTGGTLAANRLRRALDDDVAITVVDRDDDHVYQPGLLFVPFGLASAADLVRSRPHQLHGGIGYHRAGVRRVDVEHHRVDLDDDMVLPYDALVIASGARLLPEETDGLADGPGWRQTVHTFYDYDGAVALADALARFEGGRLVVDVVDLPIKCPVAPLEFCFLADWYFRQRGIRDDVTLTYVTPLDGAFTKPVAAHALAGLLAEKGIELVTEFNTGTVESTDAAGRLVSFDGREVGFDLAVVVPLHGGAAYVDASAGLGDELGFVPTDPRTLQSTVRPDIFVIGDAAAIPASKAGSVTHFEGEVLTRNVVRYLAGQELDAGFDGHANCFIESGFHKALLIDFNYDTEPLPGRFPSGIGLPLLQESRLNHLGKLMFAWLYWHVLLPGREIPGIAGAMPHAGKRVPTATGPTDPAARPVSRTTRQERRDMPTVTYAGTQVLVNDEGFFTDPEQWREEMAPEIAREADIDPLTEEHWQVIKHVRHEYADNGSGPTVRALGKTSGVTIKELYELFPKGPAKLAAKIAGIPKPRGCI